MGDQSAIEWTDATWNPFRGCKKISPGCKHCYAEAFAERFRGVAGHPYERGFDPRFVPEQLEVPLRWNKPRRVFVNSMSDLFLEDFPLSQIVQVFGMMALPVTRKHTFQVLTKRADRMRFLFAREGFDTLVRQWVGAYVRGHWNVSAHWEPSHPWPLPNVWLGVSVEDQKHANDRIPYLLRTPAAVRFVSYEPALGPVQIGPFVTGEPHLDWVIVGGESGRGARPFDPAWALDVIQQCKKARVACFVKQMGSKPMWQGSIPVLGPTGYPFLDRKAGDPEEWPPSLRVRQYPKGP